MKKMKYACGYCDARFATGTQHATHVTLECGAQAHREGRRSLRFMECWQCSEPLDRTVMECKCGWSHPSKVAW